MRYLELKTLFFYRVLSWLLHSPAKQECNEILAFFFCFVVGKVMFMVYGCGIQLAASFML